MAPRIVPAWIGTQTVPVTATAFGTTFNLLDVPDSLANATDTAYTNIPDSDFTYDTLEVAFTKRIAKAFFQASGDYQWRNELRTADMTSPASSTSPLSDRPDRCVPADLGEPERRRTGRRRRCITPSWRDITRLPMTSASGLNYRFQSGFPYAPIVPDGTVGIERLQLRLSVLLAEPRPESIGIGQPDELPDRQIVPLGGSKKATLMLDIYNLLNADPVTNFNLLHGPTYKTVIAVLDPRVFQMGFRFEF